MGRVTIFVTPWAGLMATGRMLGRGRAAPGRCSTPPWGGSGRAGKRYLVPASGSQEDGQTAHQWAGLRATGRMLGRGRAAPGRCAAAPWAALAMRMGWHLVPAPGSQQDGQTGHQRAEQKAAWPNTWQRPGSSRAVRCGSLGRLWGCLCVPLGHNQRPAQSFKSVHVGGFCAALGGAPCPNLPYTKN